MKNKIPIFSIPSQLKTLKAKLIFNFFKHIYIIERGKNDVIGRVYDSFKDLILWYTAFKVTNINPSAFQIVLTLGVIFIICYFLGWYYLRHDLDRINSMIHIQRNQFQRELYDNVVPKNKREKL
jgi:hypothetical protein